MQAQYPESQLHLHAQYGDNIISSHNKNLLSNKHESKTTIPPCNCRNSANCPLNRECREKSAIYKASITSGGSFKHYIGCTKTKFQTRYYNHTHSFRYREKRNATELSKALWNAKDSGHQPAIIWSIADPATAHQPGFRCCKLCLTEKLAILLADKRTALNQKSEQAQIQAEKHLTKVLFFNRCFNQCDISTRRHCNL